MFNNKPYFEVNREERFYCTLFTHLLLSSKMAREHFAGVVHERLDVSLNPDDLAVYTEAAVFRDYWDDLGDWKKYSAETHQKRLSVLQTILANIHVSPSIIDQNGLFWTKSKPPKLWSPGRWDKELIRQAGLDGLLEIKWAFNAKPDLLILSSNVGLIVEAKLESGQGKNSDTGYEQFYIQKRIGELLSLLVPTFRNVQFYNVIIEVKPNKET